MDDRTLGIEITKNPVGVNGIDPARQGINPFRQALKTQRIKKPTHLKTIAFKNDRSKSLPNEMDWDRSNKMNCTKSIADSLANRANAIRPYGILRFRSQFKQNAMRVILF